MEIRNIFRQNIAIQAVPIGLFDRAAGRQRPRTVEHPDIVEAEKAALKDVQALWIFRFTHQVKFNNSLWKTRARKAKSPVPL